MTDLHAAQCHQSCGFRMPRFLRLFQLFNILSKDVFLITILSPNLHREMLVASCAPSHAPEPLYASAHVLLSPTSLPHILTSKEEILTLRSSPSPNSTTPQFRHDGMQYMAYALRSTTDNAWALRVLSFGFLWACCHGTAAGRQPGSCF